MVVLKSDGQFLLLKRKNEPKQKYVHTPLEENLSLMKTQPKPP